LTTADFADVQNSNHMRSLREQFLAEKPQTCRKCWNEERGGRTSKRMHTLDRLKHNCGHRMDCRCQALDVFGSKIGQHLQFKMSYLRILELKSVCTEEINWIPREEQKQTYAYQMLRAGAWPRENAQFWQQIDSVLTDIRYIEFTGGEPS
jgi:hypothetical protein